MTEENFNDDPKANLPPDLQRIPKFGGNKQGNTPAKPSKNPVTPIDYPSERNLAQKAALSSLKYSGNAKLKPELEEDAKDLLQKHNERKSISETHTNKLDTLDDNQSPPAPPIA